MAAKLTEPDLDAAILERAELALLEWGRTCRLTSDRLGLPRSSGIARMIEVVKVFERRRAGTRAKRRKQAAKPIGEIRVCDDCGRIHHGQCAAVLTARGSQTKSFKPLHNVELSSTATTVDSIVAAAPGWMQKVLQRAYLWSQPDRLAAQDLRMTKTSYQMQREAAVEYVAERLAIRLTGAV